MHPVGFEKSTRRGEVSGAGAGGRLERRLTFQDGVWRLCAALQRPDIGQLRFHDWFFGIERKHGKGDAATERYEIPQVKVVEPVKYC